MKTVNPATDTLEDMRKKYSQNISVSMNHLHKNVTGGSEDIIFTIERVDDIDQMALERMASYARFPINDLNYPRHRDNFIKLLNETRENILNAPTESVASSTSIDASEQPKATQPKLKKPVTTKKKLMPLPAATENTPIEEVPFFANDFLEKRKIGDEKDGTPIFDRPMIKAYERWCEIARFQAATYAELKVICHLYFNTWKNDKNNGFYQSNSQIGKACKLDPRTVRAAMSKLIDDGQIVRNRKYHEYGTFYTDIVLYTAKPEDLKKGAQARRYKAPIMIPKIYNTIEKED